MENRAPTITLYSVGLLGGSIGLALKTSGFTGRIIGLSSPAAIETALSLGCIDEGHGYGALAEVVQRTDTLFLCSPIRAILSTIESLSKLHLPDGLLITDVGSTKQEITSTAARMLPSQVRFVGGHPMAGSEQSGPSHADPYLFQNAIYVLTPGPSCPAPISEEFAAFLHRYLGCTCIHLDPAVHDRIAATVSHLPHLLAVALVTVAARAEQSVPGTLQLAAGGFRDVTRIASSPYSMWHDILATNKQVIGPILDSCIELLSQMRVKLSADSLGELFDNAAATRSRIPAGNKGFISPLREVLVVAKDQPGVIASMSNALAQGNVNIKDIEVLKIREGEGGTIRLAFESNEKAQRAVTILREIGFTARER